MVCARRRLRYTLAWGLCVLIYGLVHTEQSSIIPTPITGDQEVFLTSTEEEPEWNAASTTVMTSPTSGHQEVPKPINQSCTPPAIQQFPRPLIGPSARRHGALIIHVLVCVYSFIGLAIVCDDYFVTSLDRICEVLKLSPDVAGATFMAAGSSAPELATVVIAVFLAKDDIGVSGVIGSAVFNIMFVIAVCAIFGGTVSYLNWWPLCRDSFFYLISIMAMLIVIYDSQITWGESTMLLIMYACYCGVLTYNAQLEKWAQTWPVPCKNVHQEAEGQHLVSYKTLEEKEGYSATSTMANNQHVIEKGVDQPASGMPNGSEGQATLVEVPTAQGQPPPIPPPPKPEYYKAKEPTTVQVSPLLRPETEDKMALLQWRICYPIHYAAQKTMPDCRQEKYQNWYSFTFLVSMLWISFYSYIMVWMITIIGTTLGIPDTVMGLTFVAAGVSVPDALSSLAVVKEGYGDMAVSNAVGSNVFDILICLGLPWFLKTAIIKPGSVIRVFSKGLTYSTLTLLSTVVFLLGITHMNGWKMDKRYGIILMC
uniref:Putative k+-dependent ca2+/na+ exchanger nckx1 n=1 Tax=Panstrongylus lignarius TaxID=156445 RepID=A0A224XLU0_9HEMI